MNALVALALLTGVYLGVLGAAGPQDVLLGALVSGGVLWSLRRFLLRGHRAPIRASLRRIRAFAPFAAAVLLDAWRGTLQVARATIRLRSAGASGVVVVPMAERTDRGVAVASFATTLSPGTVLLDIDWERRQMIFHVIDASDPNAVRAAHDGLYRRHQRQVFP